MSLPKSDTGSNTTEGYKASVLAYLENNDGVASKDELRQNTIIPDWYITQISTTETFCTSLTDNGRYVATKQLVGTRSDHEYFWRPEADDGRAVFHRDESTKATLKNTRVQPTIRGDTV